MIERVAVTNFKKFGLQEFELSNRIVMSGPNNSGKTTLLQAICTWAELASRWRSQYPPGQQPDLVQDSDGNYPRVTLNLLNFASVPLRDFDHLWFNKDTSAPVSVTLSVGLPKNWTVGFEILFSGQEIAEIRPTREISEADLISYWKDPLCVTYIPPASGISRLEDKFDIPVISQRLAYSQSGDVLRNMLFSVSQDEGKWSKLEEEIRSHFGYEIMRPSPGAQIAVWFRHDAQSPQYEISSAASGFLQVLTVYAALLYQKSSVVLVDEPEAHLHTLLHRKIYLGLSKTATKSNSQLVISTHSEHLIDAAEEADLRLLTYDAGLQKILGTNLKETLHLETTDIINATNTRKVLYLEGKIDIEILTAWASVLKHRVSPVLEMGFVLKTAEAPWKPMKHFESLKSIIPSMLGAQLVDHDQSSSPKTPEGLIYLRWERKEIENYLIHPEAICRYVNEICGARASDTVNKYLRHNLTPGHFQSPFDYSPLTDPPGKRFLTAVLDEVVDEYSYSFEALASIMKPEEIHPEVVQKLDQIADHLNLTD